MSLSEPLSIRQLAVFIALVEQRSFTRAAAHLGVSQSTVSGHVSDLEKRLGLRVVERDRAGVVPTEAGRVLIPAARDTLRSEQSLRMAAAELSGLLRGTLTVGGSTIPATYILPEALVGYRRLHEGVDVRLMTGDSQEILDLIHSGRVDVGVVGVAPPKQHFESSPWRGDRMCFVVAAGHPLAGKTATLADVRKERLVMREPGSGTRAAIERGLGRIKGGEPLDVAAEVGSTEAVKAAVRAGLGSAFISDLAIADEVAAGHLEVIEVADFELRREFHLVCRARDRLSPAGRSFWNLVVSED